MSSFSQTRSTPFVTIEAPNGKSSENRSYSKHEIDRLVYQLYGLTEDEIKIVENV